MQVKNTKLLLIAFVITLAVSELALGQDSVALSVAPSALRALETGGIAEGQKVRVEGIVINRNEQSFTVRAAKGTETVVVVTNKTVIKKERKGWFHREKSSSADDIRCGVALKLEGQGNSEGQLVARNITIDEPDLKTSENTRGGSLGARYAWTMRQYHLAARRCTAQFSTGSEESFQERIGQENVR